MKFLVDAQLPRRIARWLNEVGHDAVHTLDLPLRNKTTDSEINQLSGNEQRIVITKDADFVDSFILQGKPWKLCSFQPEIFVIRNWNLCYAEILQTFWKVLSPELYLSN